MDCPECGTLTIFHVLFFQQPETYNVYDLQCNLCSRRYCGVCRSSTHFPALCRERIELDTYFFHRGGDDLAMYNHIIANTVARRTMEGWRNIIGPDVFDVHPHMRFAVEELSRVSSIHTWGRVVARFSLHHEGLLQSGRFQRMITAYGLLYNTFMASMNGQPPMFHLRGPRTQLCVSVYDFLSFLRSTRDALAIVYPAHAGRDMIDYNLNFDRALRMWVYYARR